jgi:hypothetical protein
MKVETLRRREKEREKDGKKSRNEERKKQIKEGKNRENNTGMGGEKKGRKEAAITASYMWSPSLHMRLLPHQSIAGL